MTSLQHKNASSYLSHPDPYRTMVAITGLTRLGSATSRDAMHQQLRNTPTLTDTMAMFKLGLQGGSQPPEMSAHSRSGLFFWCKRIQLRKWHHIKRRGRNHC